MTREIVEIKLIARSIKMDQAAAVAALNTATSKLDTALATLGKVKDETSGLVTAVADLKSALEAAQQAGPVSAELEAAIAAVNGRADAVAVASGVIDAEVDDAPEVPGDPAPAAT